MNGRLITSGVVPKIIWPPNWILAERKEMDDKMLCNQTDNVFLFQSLQFNVIYLFVTRHEVHSISTHTLYNAGQ